MVDQRKSEASKEFEEAPDVGGPGQPQRRTDIREVAEAQSSSDLRDRRGGATDPVNPPSKPRQGDVPQTRTPHADTDPRRRSPDAVGPRPEGLKRERKGPLSPSRGRGPER